MTLGISETTEEYIIKRGLLNKWTAPDKRIIDAGLLKSKRGGECVCNRQRRDFLETIKKPPSGRLGGNQVNTIGHSGGVWLITSTITDSMLFQMAERSIRVMPSNPVANQQAATTPSPLLITARPM